MTGKAALASLCSWRGVLLACVPAAWTSKRKGIDRYLRDWVPAPRTGEVGAGAIRPGQGPAAAELGARAVLWVCCALLSLNQTSCYATSAERCLEVSVPARLPGEPRGGLVCGGGAGLLSSSAAALAADTCRGALALHTSKRNSNCAFYSVRESSRDVL